MIIEIVLLVLGLLLLIKGAGWLIDGSSALARKYNVSDLVIGLTMVAFGTSAPELVVNGFAAHQEHYDIVFGNVIGSNIFNLFMILGIAGLITPLAVKSSTVWREIPISLLAVLLALLLANYFFSTSERPELTGLEGAILLVMFLLFLFYVYRQMKSDQTVVELPSKKLSDFRLWLLIILGLAGLIAGGKLVISNAVEIAERLGISERVIGLTIIAAGTSLPELATSIMAAIKKNMDIAVGNIIGSNIFNLLLILPVSAVIRPLQYDPRFNTDFYFLGIGTLLLFIAMFSGQKKKLDRWESAILLILGVGYIIIQVYPDLPGFLF